MKRQEIAVLADEKNILFLEDFFSKRKGYRPHYFDRPSLFIKFVRDNPPTAAVLSARYVKAVSEILPSCPSIALISKDIEKTIKEAMARKVHCYIYTPFMEVDLEHKLGQVTAEKRILSALESRKKELESVVDLMHLISETLDSKELLFRIVRKISELISVTRCSIIRIDWRRMTAFVVASFENPSFRGVELDLNKYPEILAALSSKKNVIVKNVTTDPIMSGVRETISPLGIRSILVVPIFHRNSIIGTLFLRTSRAQNSFSESEINLLNSLARASSNSLYNAFLFEQVEDEKARLEKLSITDYLTGIYNIRYFYHRISEEFSRAQRYASSLSCLMLDIDHFKKINDTYGHKTGDLILKEFASLLKKSSRKSDVLARYGGEEFILLLPETTTAGAVCEAERIRLCINKHVFKSLKTRREITISVGIASYPHPRIKTHDDLIASADTALFAAKNSGRNKAAIYDN
ncbi:MAG: sensor domain-containing diguanylate cyclase [Nitrospirae bacterium]|nr:sensor domain-containing diguanylate cyclase [Nitrospirota bacterium]